MMTACERWVFLRGLGRHGRHWPQEFVAGFQRAFPGATVELLDLAGNGTEVSRESFSKVTGYLEDCRERLQSQPPVNILAISMGAMVAAEWAARHPNEIASMILMNTSSRTDCRFYQRMRPQNYLAILHMLVHKNDLPLRERTILQMTAAGLPHMEMIAAQYSQLPPTSPANFLRQIVASSQYSFPERPQIPVLFLAGESDNLVNPECSRRLAARWRSRLEVNARAGHDLPLIAADWVLEKVKLFREAPKSYSSSS
jgi:pimeloyl-ACP methyl ester carboxylesterase